MAAESLYLRTTTFTAGTAWLKTYADSLQANDIRLGRTRYTAGEVALAQADAEIGALHVSSAKILRLYRQSGTGTANDATRAALSTPIRGVWHYDDNTGEPSSAASVEGDLYVADAGSSTAWLEAYDGSVYRGLGVFAENRTTATSGAGARQNSNEVRWRSQLYTGGAAKYRDFWMKIELGIEDSVEYSAIRGWWRREEDGSDLDILTIWQNHSFNSGMRDSSTLELRDTGAASGPAITDSFVAGFRSLPGFSASTSVSRHNYFDARNVALSGGATCTDACVVRFDAAAGTHKALDSATGGAKWLKINENGTVRYLPVLDSKEMPFPGGVAYAAVSLADGSSTQTLTNSATWYQLEGFDTDGLEYNATANAASNQIDITQDGVYQVHFTASVRGDASEVYIFRIVVYTDNPSNPTIDPALGGVIGLDATIIGGTVAIHGLVDLTSGESVAVEVFNPTNAGTTLSPSYLQLSAVRVR